MKKSKYHIVYAWIVLICFAAGQGMVYAHQHLSNYAAAHQHKSDQNKTSVTEKCQLCDAMHHTGMVLNKALYFAPVVCADHIYKQGDYDFISISLILSPGRAPPVSSLSA